MATDQGIELMRSGTAGVWYSSDLPAHLQDAVGGSSECATAGNTIHILYATLSTRNAVEGHVFSTLQEDPGTAVVVVLEDHRDVLSWSAVLPVPCVVEDQPREFFLASLQRACLHSERVAALERARQEWEELVRNLPEMVCRFLPDGTLTFVNEAYAEQFGQSSHNLAGRSLFDLIPPEARDAAHQQLKTYTPENPTGVYEHEVIVPSGHTWQEWTDKAVFSSDGHVQEFYSVGRDVSARRAAQQEAQLQLEQKAVLLRETHHRIKNNLTSIGALLSMQLRDSHSEETRTVLQDTLTRVRSIQVLYEQLLLEEQQDRVDAHRYLPELVHTILSTFTTTGAVQVNTEVETIALVPRAAFTVALMVNELVTNAMKYALTAEKNSSPTLTLTLATERETIVLTVTDNGPGLPEDFDPEAPRREDGGGFGTYLVKMLTEELGGDVVWSAALQPRHTPGVRDADAPQGLSGTTVTVRLPQSRIIR